MGEEEKILVGEGEGEEEGEAKCCRCDFCGEHQALLYCRADSARLCLSCDRHVHSANSVCSKHPRSLLCDLCSSNPSSILCSSHRLLLCPNCDFDAHRGADRHHDRRPVEPFSGCPTVSELVSVLGVGAADEKKAVVEGEEDVGGGFDGGFSALDVWETPAIFSLDDLIVPTTSCHGFQAMGIPPLPKNRNLACGKHKEEILRQLRELINTETHVSNDHWELESVKEIKSWVPQQNLQLEKLDFDFAHDATFMVVPSCEVNAHQWQQSDSQEASDPVKFPFEQSVGSYLVDNPSFHDAAADDHKEIAHPVIRENVSLSFKGGHELACPDRQTVISRYKEKRKTRRYDKLIRYESRKARADTRTRVKGRFAKVNQGSKS